MNWYELASADEVEKNLRSLLYQYDFAEMSWEQGYLEEEPVSCIKIPYQGFEIAEALWGEYSEEVF